MTTSKDEKWNDYFDDNKRYADIINAIGCDGEQLVKDTDLQEVDSKAGKKARDMLRKVAFGTNFALIGIENQETIDYEIPLRSMRYDAFHYQKQANEIAKRVLQQQKEGVRLEAGEYLYRFRKDSRLHPIVTFVLYFGKEPWDGPRRLHDILDFSNVPDKLKSMIPDYPVHIVDVRRLENTEVFKTDVRYVFDFIRCAENKSELYKLVSQNPYYKEMDEDAFHIVTNYTNSEELVDSKKYETEGGKRNVCKAIRDLMEDSRQEGRKEGREEGREEGRREVFENMIRKLRVQFSDEEIAELLKEPLIKVQAI